MRFPPLSVVVLGCLLMAGCTRPATPVVVVKPPEVIFDRPALESVADYEEFTGRITAYKSVDVKARVTGYLEAPLRFKDGDEVDQGAPLFDIDPLPYQAELERAKAAVKQAQAKVNRLTRDDTRAKELLPRNAISQEEADRIAGELAEAVAGVGVADAQEKLAQQNLNYTHIKSPIKGRIGKRSIDPGNLVKADETLLATIVHIDTVYADFDVDDRTMLRMTRLSNSGEIASTRGGKTRVRIGLPDEEGFSKDGLLTFEDNKLNSGTGTKAMRAEVVNADRLIEPGLFVRVRVPIGEPKPSILVPEVAIGTDQGLKYLFVLDADDKVEYRRVIVGMQIERMRVGGGAEQFRVVEAVPEMKNSGVLATDRLIFEGLQRVRAGAKVTPKPRNPTTYLPLANEWTRREPPAVSKPVSTTNAGSR